MPPNSTPAPDPKLATEAKLCAYLEGALPPEDRGEIESYLQHNPQHRQLLKELRGTRELLQHLPAESAPPEIAESFEQQLERSLLLDDLAIDPVPRGRGGPQKLLIAALVLLACGLGVVIYLALPGAPIATQKLTSLNPLPTTGPAVDTSTVIPPIPTVTTMPALATTAPVVAHVAPTMTAEPPFEYARRLLIGQAVSPQQTALLTLSSDDAAASAMIADYFRASVIPVQRLAEPSTAPSTQPIRNAAILAPATRPATEPIQLSSNPTVPPTTQTTGNALNAPADPTTAASDDRRAFFARSLSFREATRLQSELAAAYPSDAIRFYAPAEWNPAIGQPMIAADQPLTVTVDQLVGPGVEKTNTVRVSADGTVMLPMLLEPIPAAGLSMAELQARIADRYRDAHLIAHPTVTVVPGPIDTQPTAGANTPVTTEPIVAAPPTTTAVPPDAGQNINLLVLLLHPGEAAATQPALH